MTSAVQLCEALTTAPDDKARAKLIAEAFERLEERYPHLPDLATRAHLRETELRLRMEIEQVRAELRAELEQIRAEMRTELERIRAEFRTESDQVKKEITDLKLEIARVKTDLIKWIVPLMFAQVAVIAALVKLL
ncbi:MAG: CCDC90 family protein [Candidatus Thiosymbion ectosymbiont of Robbea hypermnestra]|nr:CCDC90 family protein [Candidatus Thiosymbion ectosymbiont of Robbea hypermnestra]